MNDENKSHKTAARIGTVKQEIKAHRKNIKWLKKYSNKIFPKNGGPFAPRIVKYTFLPQCEKRHIESIHNLTQQILELEKELLILVEYGA